MDESRIRFLILAQSRSGTQLLRTLLGEHPGIHCDGELLHLNLEYAESRARREFFRFYPDPLLECRETLSTKPVYGFNLMFYHLRFPGLTLKRLLNADWRIIHVMRENLLQIAFSFLIAKETGKWHRHEGEMQPDYTVTISPAELQIELSKRIRWRAKELELMREMPHLKIIYERDLKDSSQWQSACDRIFNGLSIAPHRVSSTMRKTDARTYPEIIGNYAELVAWLEASPHRGYLESMS